MSHSKNKPNSLISANSPYLLQHAYNPVNWNEWSSKVLATALSENKLMIVSIGYAACHWCHVMEKECFEDTATAELMNTHFINIKVDREERPDIDQVYMDAIQLMTGQGGWPLNAICLPNGKPLYVGTYFPKTKWNNLLLKLVEFFTHDPEDAYAYANKLSMGLTLMENFESDPDTYISNALILQQIAVMKQQIDWQFGGFNWAPKFLLPINWELFLQFGSLFNDKESIAIARLTSEKIVQGGIYDLLAGGFSRYSTDSRWLVPHFEKMLYDNAQMMSLLAKLYSQSKNENDQKIIEQTFQFLTNELKGENGLYFAAIDADTLGEEGLFYVWSAEEIKSIVPNNWELAFAAFGIVEEGNWEHGKNVLYQAKSDEALAVTFKLTVEEVITCKEKICEQLYLNRLKRNSPMVDNKQLCAWNALLVIGLADASKALNSDKYRSACKSLIDAMIAHFYIDKSVYRIVKNEQRIIGFAEDYALFCEALLLAAEACNDSKYLLLAKEIMDLGLLHFFDEEQQLFQFSSKIEPVLIKKKFDVQDSVMPSSNATFAKCLFYLSYYFDVEMYEQIGDDLLHKIIPKIKEQGLNYSKWMQVILLKSEGFNQVIATGKNALTEIQQFQQNFMPNTVCFAIETDALIPLFKDKPITQELSIYVCRDKTCDLPINNLQAVHL